MDSPPCVHVALDLLLMHGDMTLRLAEAFVVWEPLPRQGPNLLIQKTFKHTYLLFALEPGQVLYGNEYRYLRVERQQLLQHTEDGRPPAPHQEEALLNIRFCNTMLQAEALDIPGVDGMALTSHNLYDLGVRQCERSVRFTAEQVTLGQLLEVVMCVHNSQPAYSITGANCIWFGDEVLNGLIGVAQTHELKRALAALSKEFRSHPRSAAARGWGPLVDRVAELRALFGHGPRFVPSAADVGIVSQAVRASAVVGKHGVVTAVQRALA